MIELNKGYLCRGIWNLFCLKFLIQHCFICRIEQRDFVTTLALAVRCSNHSVITSTLYYPTWHKNLMHILEKLFLSIRLVFLPSRYKEDYKEQKQSILSLKRWIWNILFYAYFKFVQNTLVKGRWIFVFSILWCYFCLNYIFPLKLHYFNLFTEQIHLIFQRGWSYLKLRKQLWPQVRLTDLAYYSVLAKSRHYCLYLR